MLDEIEFSSNIGECLNKTANNFSFVDKFISNQIMCNRKLYEDILEIRKNFDHLKFALEIQTEMINRLSKELEEHEKRKSSS